MRLSYEHYQKADIIGVWRAEYSNYINANADFVEGTTRITGVEELVFDADGTYTQSYHSAEFEYDSLEYRWQLIAGSDEGPKLIMHNLKYFAFGMDLTDGPLNLRPQMADLLRHQRSRAEMGSGAEKLTVDYPEDGFVFLYPRHCLGKLSLLQMTSGPGDPDALAVDNPIFSKVR